MVTSPTSFMILRHHPSECQLTFTRPRNCQNAEPHYSTRIKVTQVVGIKGHQPVSDFATPNKGSKSCQKRARLKIGDPLNRLRVSLWFAGSSHKNNESRIPPPQESLRRPQNQNPKSRAHWAAALRIIFPSLSLTEFGESADDETRSNRGKQKHTHTKPVAQPSFGSRQVEWLGLGKCQSWVVAASSSRTA